MNRYLLGMLLVVLIAGAVIVLWGKSTGQFFAAAPTPTPVPLEKVRIGVSHVPIRAMIVFMGKKQGIFKAEGLDPQITQFDTLGAQILLSKKLDFVVTTLNTYLLASAQGGDTKWVASVLNIEPYFIVSKDKKEQIKKVAIFRLGGEDMYYAITGLELMGVDTSKVEFIQSGTNEAKLPLLQKGSVDAAGYVLLPAFSKARTEFKKEGVNILSESSTYKSAYSPSGIITLQSVISSRPKVVQKMVNAVEKSVVYIRGHKKEAIALLKSQYDYNEKDAEEVYDAFMRGTDNLRVKPEVPYLEKTIVSIKKFNAKVNIPKDYHPSTFVDTSFVK